MKVGRECNMSTRTRCVAAICFITGCEGVLRVGALRMLSVSSAPLPPAKRIRFGKKMSPFYMDLLQAVGPEDPDAGLMVYLVTVSRVLPRSPTIVAYRNLDTVAKEELANMVRDALDNPVIVTGAAGRPRARTDAQIDIVVVVQEQHADGSTHFHVVVKMLKHMRFARAKLTLQERYQLPSHWSCSHKQLWSAIRYVHVPTPKKPVTDQNPFVWTRDGRLLDLVDLSNEPWTAVAWRKRRQAEEAKAAIEETKAPSMNKLDFYALVISKHLHTKASLLAYVQDYGSVGVNLFVAKNQRLINQFIEDAHEWEDAKRAAMSEKLTEWDILVKAADTACAHAPGACPYAMAVADIFRQNAHSFSPQRLASSLKNIFQHGPSKTCLVPLLVGPSNTGKSTLLFPLDDLFGPKHVFHKPAVGSTFALRNIVQRKRLIFWDDYRPVEYAHTNTVPVGAFLSLFQGKYTEVTASQSFNDGNLDVQWNKPVVFTAKEEDLWKPTEKVSQEDIRHMKNRCEMFHFTRVVHNLRDIDSCAPCMARWIRAYSDASAPALPASVPGAAASSGGTWV